MSQNSKSLHDRRVVALVEALEETQGLLVAMLHETRPREEIEAQIRDNRTVLQIVAQQAQTDRAPTDEQIRRAMILTPAYSDDADYAHWIRMGRAVLAIDAQPASGGEA